MNCFAGKNLTKLVVQRMAGLKLNNVCSGVYLLEEVTKYNGKRAGLIQILTSGVREVK